MGFKAAKQIKISKRAKKDIQKQMMIICKRIIKEPKKDTQKADYI